MRSKEFFTYLQKREHVRRNKAADLPYPWSYDDVLNTIKFTNVKREHDKTSQLLIEEFYEPNKGKSKREILMNCALFRYFGTIEFAREVGWQEFDNFDFDGIIATAQARLARGEKVFTGAYVITNQGIKDNKEKVVVNVFLKGLKEKVQEICLIAIETKRWEDTANIMKQIHGFGGTGFMTKEILIDTTYTNFWSLSGEQCLLPDDWNSWTPVGPGSIRGAMRVLGLNKEPSAKETLQTIKDLFICRDKYTLFEQAMDMELCLTDIQFGLCEFDKYERVRLGQGRAKNKYRPKSNNDGKQGSLL